MTTTLSIIKSSDSDPDICEESVSSMAFMSAVNKLSRRPESVVSKNESGAPSSALSMRPWMPAAAFRPPCAARMRKARIRMHASTPRPKYTHR